jgi:limonene-1,2-epoxide hydrolase
MAAGERRRAPAREPVDPVDAEPRRGPDPDADPVEVVRAFLAALEALDVDAALELVSPDIVYQNVPLPPARGLAEFSKQMRFLERYCTGFEATLHRVAADDDGSVLTERTDVLERGALRAGFWVCGTFEVVDGRITVWRDRFDWATVVGSVLLAIPRAAVRSLSGSS